MGEVWALLAKLSTALADPVLCGLNVTVNGTLLPAGIVVGKLRPLKLNVELFVPADVTVTLAPVAVKLPEAEPLVPTITLPSARVVGEMPSCPAADVPVPDSGMERDGLEAFEPIVMLPPNVPAAVGANFALTVQLAPGASVPGTAQVPMLPQLNGAAVMELLRKLTVALPVFVRVVVRMELVCPTAMLPKAILVGLAESVPIDCPKVGGVRRMTSRRKIRIQRARKVRYMA